MFKAMRLRIMGAIRSLLQQTVNVGGLLFGRTALRPNAETVAAMRDIRSGQNLSSFDTFDDMMKELDA